MQLLKNKAYAKVKMNFLQSELTQSLYSSSYSHGLEKIYALENVDIRSVRKIATSPAQEPKKSCNLPLNPIVPSDQLPLEPGFRKTLEPFLFREPIQVLSLSKKLEQSLFDQKKYHLEDLLEQDRKTFASIEKIGQGHLDEIHYALRRYLEEHLSFAPGQAIDFNSWVRTLIADEDPKKTAVLMAHFGLPSAIHLAPSENAEVRKLNPEKRISWVQEITKKLQTTEKIQQAHRDIQTIAHVFTQKWIYDRAGLASKNELQEHLKHLSGSDSSIYELIDFMSAIFFENQSLFDVCFPCVDEEIYAADLQIQTTYQIIIKIAMTYFYKSTSSYSLGELKQWIERESARQWLTIPESFVERAIHLCPNFLIRRDFSGMLTVRLK